MKFAVDDKFIIEGNKMTIYRLEEERGLYMLIDARGIFRVYSEEFLLYSNLVKKI